MKFSVDRPSARSYPLTTAAQNPVTSHSSADPKTLPRILSSSKPARSFEVPSLPVFLRAGEVWLVGAGPGDPGLVTLSALEALRQADVIVHDRLGCEEILFGAAPNTRLVPVGKQPGGGSTPQEEIHRILLEEARGGNRVVRLKGGDPYVFGRGMEEALALGAEGIPVRVIPGVSSAIAAPLSAGIPVTHRGIARGFNVYTGHDSAGDIPAPGQADTRIFLMAMGHLQEIVSGLLAEGLSPQTPVAIVSNATTYRQRSVSAPLAEICDVAKSRGIAAPAVVVVGETARFYSEAHANPAPSIMVAATRLPARFAELFPGRQPLWRPVHRIVPLEGTARSIARTGVVESLRNGWLLFTNPHAVRGFFELLAESGRDARMLRAGVAAIGEEAAAALGEFAIIPDRVVVDGGVNAAVEELRPHVSGGRVVVVASEGYEGGLCRALEALPGVSATALGVYTSIATTAGPVDWAFVEGVYFASPRNVRHFAEVYPDAPLEKLTAWSNGGSVARLAREKGFQTVIDLTENAAATNAIEEFA